MLLKNEAIARHISGFSSRETAQACIGFRLDCSRAGQGLGRKKRRKGESKFFMQRSVSPRTAHPGASDSHSQVLKGHPGYWFWKIDRSWVELTSKFAQRIFGHRQITDACLLGLGIKEDGVLVTFDRGLKYMAGAEFARNLLVIE